MRFKKLKIIWLKFKRELAVLLLCVNYICEINAQLEKLKGGIKMKIKFEDISKIEREDITGNDTDGYKRKLNFYDLDDELVCSIVAESDESDNLKIKKVD